MWCGVNRQRAERSRALGPVRPTSDATRAANAAQPTARRRRQRRRPTHPRNTHERAATSDATNTTTTSSRCRCHGTAARLRGGRTHEECSAGGALQAGAIEKGPHDPSKLHQHRPHRPSSQTGCTRTVLIIRGGLGEMGGRVLIKVKIKKKKPTQLSTTLTQSCVFSFLLIHLLILDSRAESGRFDPRF